MTTDSSALNPLAAASSAPSRPAIAADASLNYSVAKVLAIFTVAAGHWFTGTLLWIPVTFGLFVFAFSSGFFTTAIYGERIERRSFWRKKLERLGVRYWVILAFLTVVVALNGKTVLHWHTLVHFAGLSGVLNWAHVPNRSGLGGGLWFFTLLLAFYLAYPALARAGRCAAWAAPLAVGATALSIYLEEHVPVGHELWLTALGFVLGVLYASHATRVSTGFAALLALVSCALLLVLNAALHEHRANPALMTFASTGIAIWLAQARLPAWPVFARIARLERYLLEIFLVHIYLFVRPSGSGALDFALSMALVVGASVALNRIAGYVTGYLFDSRQAAR